MKKSLNTDSYLTTCTGGYISRKTGWKYCTLVCSSVAFEARSGEAKAMVSCWIRTVSLEPCSFQGVFRKIVAEEFLQSMGATQRFVIVSCQHFCSHYVLFKHAVDIFRQASRPPLFSGAILVSGRVFFENQQQGACLDIPMAHKTDCLLHHASGEK